MTTAYEGSAQAPLGRPEASSRRRVRDIRIQDIRREAKEKIQRDNAMSDMVDTIDFTKNVVTSNFVRVKIHPRTIYQYHIDFFGEKANAIRRELCLSYLNEKLPDNTPENIEKRRGIIFLEPYYLSISPIPEFELNVPKTYHLTKYRRDFQVQLEELTEVPTIEELQVSEQDKEHFFNKVFQLVFLEHFGLHTFRKFFDPSDFCQSDTMRVYSGYKADATFVAYESETSQLVLNINPVCKVMSSETVQDVCLRMRGMGLDVNTMRETVIGHEVSTLFTPQRMHTVLDLKFDAKLDDKLPDKCAFHAENWTYREYCQKIRNYECKGPDNQVFVDIQHSHDGVALPGECLLSTDIPKTEKDQLPIICSVHPEERRQKIADFLAQCIGDNNKFLDQFGLEVEPNMLKVNATRLPMVSVVMSDNRTSIARPAGWQGDSSRSRFQGETKQRMPFIMCWSDKAEAQSISQEIYNKIDADLKQRNAPVHFANCPEVVNLSMGGNALNDMMNAFNNARKKYPKLMPADCVLLCFLPNGTNEMGKRVYSQCKGYCNQNGIVSQFINLHAHVSGYRKNPQKIQVIAQNLTKAIINKFGRLVWTVNVPQLGSCFRGKSVMMIGIDIFHSRKFMASGGSFAQRRSIAAFVAIILTPDGQWLHYANHYVRRARTEILFAEGSERTLHSGDTELEGKNETDLIAKFIKEVATNVIGPKGVKVDEVLVYRDGVGHSMADAVQENEVAQIKRAIPQGTNLTFAILQKRIGARFWVDGVQPKADMAFNVPRGTVVEELADMKWQSFYLIPTQCSLSTVVPVRYLVLCLSPEVPMQQFQATTFGLCHMYPNWTNSVKLPFPTQCAQKYSLLVGDLPDEEPETSKQLRTGFFYL